MTDSDEAMLPDPGMGGMVDCLFDCRNISLGTNLPRAWICIWEITRLVALDSETWTAVMFIHQHTQKNNGDRNMAW